MKRAEVIPYLLDILPDLALLIGIAQKISRMKRGHQFRSSEIDELPAQSGDGLSG